VLVLALCCASCAARHAVVSPPPSAPAPSPRPSPKVVPKETAQPQSPTPAQLAAARQHVEQAYRLWSDSKLDEARTAVQQALAVVGRSLPVAREPVAPSRALAQSRLSDDGRLLLLIDEQSVGLFSADQGQPLGFVLRDREHPENLPQFTPDGQYALMPAGDELVLYDTEGLREQRRFEVRPGAPFAFADGSTLLTARLGAAPEPELDNDAAASRDDEDEDQEPESNADDEIVLLDWTSGKELRRIELAAPPMRGLARRVARLPGGRQCVDDDDCLHQCLDPAPVGRRLIRLEVHAEVVIGAWRGGDTTLHRLSDGRLLGAFRARGETWRPPQVAVHTQPARAAVITSYASAQTALGPPLSVVALLDLSRGTVRELLEECRWGTSVAFSADGNRVMVGDPLRACLHDAKTGQLLAVTDQVRPEREANDDQQDVTVSPIASGRWLTITDDGAFGVFDEPSSSFLLRGTTDSGQWLRWTEGERLYIEDTSSRPFDLVMVSAQQVERRALLPSETDGSTLPPELAGTTEGRQRQAIRLALDQTCPVLGYRLPAALCQ